MIKLKIEKYIKSILALILYFFLAIAVSAAILRGLFMLISIPAPWWAAGYNLLWLFCAISGGVALFSVIGYFLWRWVVDHCIKSPVIYLYRYLNIAILVIWNLLNVYIFTCITLSTPLFPLKYPSEVFFYFTMLISTTPIIILIKWFPPYSLHFFSEKIN